MKALYDEKPDMTSEQLYYIACELAQQDGWVFGAHLAGHTIGLSRTSAYQRTRRRCIDIVKDNHESMAVRGKDGLKWHWILEIHLLQ